jgi:predicted dehydrogenase
MAEPVKAVLVGAGQRGAEVYGGYAGANPARIKFVAVAEPVAERRASFAGEHRIEAAHMYESWEPLFAQPQLGQAALICTPDQLHTGPAAAALKAGYHVLLEKPMATSEEDCRSLVQAAREADRQLHICHVLRYAPHFSTIRDVIRSGELGQIVTIMHQENVSRWHMSHSFVRGSWRNSEESSPMILAKCCHDFDILLWLLDRRCLSLASTGSLIHFREENAPEGAPDYCLDGCPVANSCPYYAPYIYIEQTPFWQSVAGSVSGLDKLAVETHLRAPWATRGLSRLAPGLRQMSDYRQRPFSMVCSEPSRENLLEALKDGPYGRCVYRCDNNVVDHQVVLMTFEDGISVSLTMHGHSNLEGRTTRIQGSHGELEAFLGLAGGWVEVRQQRGRSRRIDTSPEKIEDHGGGDTRLMNAFIDSLVSGQTDQARTTVEQALESHLLAFAAEKARLEERVISRAEFSPGSRQPR